MSKQKRSNSRGIALIKKSNSLIESRFKFDIWETRFFLSVLAQIKRDDEEFKVYRIWYKDIVKSFGLKSNQAYHLLREGAKSLMDKSFYVSYEQDGVGREIKYHILRKLDYMRDGEEGKRVETQEYIDVLVEDEMKPLLLQLQKNFTAYDLRNVRKLGAYPVRVYELLKQYERIGERTIYIEEMKRMFELENEYPRFPNFFQKVVKPAISEINRHTDLFVSNIEYIKEGKKVVGLQFFFGKKDAQAQERSWNGNEPAKPIEIPFAEEASVVLAPRPEPDNAGESVPDQTYLDEVFLKYQQVVVGELGVSPSIFLQQLGRCTEAQIEKAIRVTQRARKENRLKNPSGFFVEALRNDYTDAKEELARRKQEEQVLRAAEHELAELEYELTKHINDRIRELTMLHPEITPTVIATLREDPLAKTYILNKEKELQKVLDVEEFRRDKVLREWVKNRIIGSHEDFFQPKLSELGEKMDRAKSTLRRLAR